MNRHLRVLCGAVLAFVAACRGSAPTPAPPPVPADPASFANVEAFVGTHLELDLSADFDTRRLSGTASLTFIRRDARATEVVLDTRDLEIRRVEAAIGAAPWVETTHRLGTASAAFGQALRITMPPGADRVRVTYATSPEARGLQWLTPAQTAGRRHPFLFSQAQAIQARSFVPLQDAPGVRVTYDATLRVPRPLVAVMAADAVSSDADAGVFRFRMAQPIPSYLIALAVGDLQFRAMSDRTGVWSEPGMLDRAAVEFADTEQMMQATEALYGSYRWGRYDLLVLPPSFPFGGMENPRLTFTTPTIIAGDKSLVSLVAHELAHSWSGNLATNATWADFWLNEGVTTYLERRIVEAIYGRPRAEMEAMIGVRDLEQGRADLTAPRDRTLLPDLAGRDPDDAFSTVPYEQGALFLSFLEARFGREVFDAFLRRWFDDHAFGSVTTEDFLAAVRSQLMPKDPSAVTEAQLQEWLTSETVPTSAVLPRSDTFDRVDTARTAWLGGGRLDDLAGDATAWSTQEWLRFIDGLPRDLARAPMTALDRRFSLTSSSNAEIAHVWFRLAIATGYAPATPALERYLLGIGRRKLIVPLYRDLAATPDGRARALEIYRRARGGYHPLAQAAIDPIVGYPH